MIVNVVDVGTSIITPPPPSEPAPPNQPTIHTGFGRSNNVVKLSNMFSMQMNNQRSRNNDTVTGYRSNQEMYANIPNSEEPPKPMPIVRKAPALPRVKALYDYSPRDLDELEFKEDDVIEVLNERTFLLFNIFD